MRLRGTMGGLAVVWMVHVGLFVTCSAHNQTGSTVVVCETFATNETVYAVCSPSGYTATSLYDVDPCLTASSKLRCDRFEFLSPTSCLSKRSAAVLEKVISTIPTSVTSIEMLILQARDYDTPCWLDIPQHLGNFSSLSTLSLVLDTGQVNFSITFHPPNKNSSLATTGFLNSVVLRRIIYFSWPRHYISPVYFSGCKCNDYYYVDDANITLPIREGYIYLLCKRCSWFNCPNCSCCASALGLILLSTSLLSVILLIVIVTAVICFCRKRRERRLTADETPRCLETYQPGLIIVYVSGDQAFDQNSPKVPFITGSDVSYHTIEKPGSWAEILYNFNTKPGTACVTLITSNYLDEMRRFLEKANDDDMCSQVTSFHLSQRTFPVLIGDINVDDFPTSLRAVYFKLNLHRWPNYPGDCPHIQNTFPRIHTRSDSFMDWCEAVDRNLKLSHDKVNMLISQLEAGCSDAILQKIFRNQSICFTVGENVRIGESVQTVMENLRLDVTKQDNMLSGTLFGVGSYWDGTRVGEAPNEFDYLYVLSDVNKCIKECYKCGIWKYRLKCKEPNSLTGGSTMLSNFMVREHLCVFINRSMKTLSLPKNLHHGGVLSPQFSGVRRNGPAITLLFIWTGGQYRSKPLLISVDVTIAIRPVHLQAFMQDESILLADHQFQFGLRVLPESYLIADANFDKVWQRTTAKVEVSLVSKMRPWLSNTIKMLKILSDLMLTIREPEGNSSMDGNLKNLSLLLFHDVTKHTETTPIESIGCWTVKDESCSLSNTRTSGDQPIVSSTRNAIHKTILSLVAARNLHTTQVNSNGKEEPPPDEKSKYMSGLATKLGQLLLEDTKMVNEDNPILEQETTISSEVQSSEFSYISDVLDPSQCHILFEDCKPLIALKSCVFKYTLMKLLQLGEASANENTANDYPGFDRVLLVKIMKKIQRSKQLMHPLLGYPIMTYSVSPRVQHCTGQNRRLTQDTENRLSEILYDVLGLLIETLDRESQSGDTLIEMTTKF